MVGSSLTATVTDVTVNATANDVTLNASTTVIKTDIYDCDCD
jgi:hypothetical protein